ncbi:hypothetical protein P5F80_19830 [Shouchella clausii]|nr:hypothetical protein [Shouchella clausii]MED4178771.1 hypothetical protein [Shouchella clausii]
MDSRNKAEGKMLKEDPPEEAERRCYRKYTVAENYCQQLML